MEIWVRLSPKVCQYTILKRHLVQLDGFDANKTKKTKWTENTETSSPQQNDYPNKVMVKTEKFFGVLLFSKCSSFR